MGTDRPARPAGPAARPPEWLEAGRLRLRRLGPDDAERLDAAVTASLEHLRPWMPWAAEEPAGLDRRRQLLGRWAAAFDAGEEFVYGAFDGDELVGVFGLHRRLGPDGLEIGYWVHVDHVGRGVATTAAGALTDCALALEGVERVEIHHDRANRRSGRVPAKLGYRLVAQRPDDVSAPGEEGVECVWRVTAAERPTRPRP